MGENTKKNTRLIILTFSVMLVLGFVMSLRGVLIPSIRESFNVSYSDIGLMIFVVDMGYMLATFFGGIVGQRYGLKLVLILGFLLVIIGIACMNFTNSFVLTIVLLFLVTTGTGCFDIGANSLGAGIFVTNAAVMMNLLHFFFGVGSSASPKYAGWLLSAEIKWPSVYTYALILVGMVFIFLLLIRFPKGDGWQQSDKTSVKSFIKDRRVWLFTAVLGCSVVAELGIANWLVNFLQQIHGLDVDSSSFYLSLFFIVFTGGRLVGGFLAERLGYIKLLLYFAAATAVVFAAGLALGSGWIVLLSIAGFFISTMYPTVVTAIVKEFSTGSTAILGFVMTAAMAVSMIGNWLVGKISDLLGVWAGFASISVYVVLMIIALIGLNGALTNEGMKLKILRRKR